jgi:hypothetical protein
VVQSPDVRLPIVADGNVLVEPYLGVAFTAVPEIIEPWLPAVYLLELFYWPQVDYSALQPGATFTVREGGSIVGFGVVRERIDPEPMPPVPER